MVYYAQCCQNKTSIVSNWHFSLHTKLMLLFSGHSLPFRYLCDFLRLRNKCVAALIENEN